MSTSEPARREEHPPPKRDLSILTSPPKLNPRPKRTRPAPEPSEPAEHKPATGEETKNPATATTSPPAAKRHTRKAPASAEADKFLTSARAINVDPDLAAELAAFRHRTRMSNTQVILASLKQFHTQLPDMVAQDNQITVVEGELWDEVVTQSGQRRSPVQFYPTNQQLEVMSRLVEESGARDRSQMLGLTLRAYLTAHSEDS